MIWRFWWYVVCIDGEGSMLDPFILSHPSLPHNIIFDKTLMLFILALDYDGSWWGRDSPLILVHMMFT